MNRFPINIRRGNLEVRWTQTSPEIIEWCEEEGKEEYCYTLAWWREDKEGFQMEFCGSRPFKLLHEDAQNFWKLCKVADHVLNQLWLYDNGYESI